MDLSCFLVHERHTAVVVRITTVVKAGQVIRGRCPGIFSADLLSGEEKTRCAASRSRRVSGEDGPDRAFYMIRSLAERQWLPVGGEGEEPRAATGTPARVRVETNRIRGRFCGPRLHKFLFMSS